MTEFENHKQGNTAAQQKLALSHLLSQTSTGVPRAGVLTGLSVTQSASAGPAVLISAGSTVVATSVLLGASQLVSDATKTVDVLTANPVGSLPRNDLVVFDRTVPEIKVLLGTPNAAPTDPTLPSTAFRLARLRHAANATTIPTAKIDDLRVYTAPKNVPVPVASKAARDALVGSEPLQVWRLDLDVVQTYTNGSWGPVWSPLALSNSALYTVNGTSPLPQVTRVNGIVYMAGAMQRVDGADLTSFNTFITLGTLASTYWPAHAKRYFSDASFALTNVGGHLWISTTGVITFAPPANACKWVAFDNVSFPAADH